MPKSDDKQRLLFGVMLAVAVWGSILALGAFLFGPDLATGQVTFAPNAVRGGIVLGFVVLFVGGWALLLRGRKSA
jgi:hypothetical protein